MDEITLVESEESGNSVVELEIPRKPTPPLIFIEDEEIILNVMQENREVFLAKDFIANDKELSEISNGNTGSDYVNCPQHWTKDMIKYYDEDWGGEEHFVVEEIQKKMDKRPSLWKVSVKGSYLESKNWKRHIKCWDCNKKGHYSIDCPLRNILPKCFMCGIEGHVEQNCPNSKCLNCGRPANEYIICCRICRSQQGEVCSRCQIIGHNFINCPDHWRLFHLTTGTTSVVVPHRNIYKSGRDIWCCNCGKKGHYQINCNRKKNTSGFMDTLPYVVSYENAFKNNHTKNISVDLISKSKKRRQRRKRKQEQRSEKILKLNPMHSSIKKDKVTYKNKVERFRKFKRSKKRRRENQGFWEALVL